MRCEQCLKSADLCLCEIIQPMNPRIQVLILQHPQEPNHPLGTARLTHLALKNSLLKVGLSWPNLQKAVGKEVQPSAWAVLYLGSGVKEAGAVGSRSPQGKPKAFQFVSKQGVPVAPPQKLEGIVILDGTWSQAKALWWRNAWLLKLRRVILIPSQKSIYQGLRKEPRPECVSTLESIAESLTHLGEDPKIESYLKGLFQQLLDRKRRASHS